MMFSNIG